MIVKTFPEFFTSARIYELVDEVLKRNLREKDVGSVMKELLNSNPQSDNYIKKLAFVLKRHMSPSKVSSITMELSEKLNGLLKVEHEPRKIEISKNGKEILKFRVSNNVGTDIKVRLGVQQLDRKFTAMLYDPVKSFGYTKLVKTMIIPAGKTGVFKFIIQADIFGIQDIHELKEKNNLVITLGAQAEADGIDGMKTRPVKIPIKIVKVKI